MERLIAKLKCLDRKKLGSLTLVIEDLLFKGLKSLNFFVKF